MHKASYHNLKNKDNQEVYYNFIGTICTYLPVDERGGTQVTDH